MSRLCFYATARLLVAAISACALAAPAWARGEADERGPMNGADLCANATPIAGSGIFQFNNTTATTDGASHPTMCLAAGDAQIWKDLWWRWTAPCDGPVTLETCNLTSINTRLAVYAPLAPGAPSADYLIACNDDACGVRSSVTFLAIAGQEYLLRLGVYNNGPGGPGSFRITCSTRVVCSGHPSICQERNLAGTPRNSDNMASAADNFTFPAAGYISNLCWRGGNTGSVNDAFRITYWNSDANGRPYQRIADFKQASGQLLIRKTNTGSTLVGGYAEQEYSALHASVPLAAGVRYWVEIRNTGAGSETWVWAAGTGGDGMSLHDTTTIGVWGNAATIASDRAVCLAYESACLVDTNADGRIDFQDLNNILSYINTLCP